MFGNAHVMYFYKRPDIKSSVELKEILMLSSLSIIYKSFIDMSTGENSEVVYV